MADRVALGNGGASGQCSVDLSFAVFNWIWGSRAARVAALLAGHVEHPLDARGAIRIPEIGMGPINAAIENGDDDTPAGDAVFLHGDIGLGLLAHKLISESDL